MDEVDARTCGTDLRLRVQHAGSLLLQVRHQRLQVSHANCVLLNSWPLLVQVLCNRGLVIQRRENLNESATFNLVGRADHGLVDTLLFIDFIVVVDETKVCAIPLNSGIKIRDCDTDVINSDYVLMGNGNLCLTHSSQSTRYYRRHDCRIFCCPHFLRS